MRKAGWGLYFLSIMRKRIQNKVSESRFLLPVMSAYGLLVWLAGGLIGQQMFIQLAAFAVSTYLMVELNNSNALLNMYSRMVSGSFIALTMTAAFLFPSIVPWVVQLCLVAAYLLLSRCYQDRYAQGTVFYAFLCIGIASIGFIQIVFFVPVLLVLMAVNLMNLSIRNFWAALLGLLTPWWVLAGYLVFIGKPETILSFVCGIQEFSAPFHNIPQDPHRLVTFAYVSVIALTGAIHYLRNSYKDKIRTRMIYETLITMTGLEFLFIVLQPQHFDMLFPMFTVSASVLIAHYISQTNKWLTNMSFYLIVILTVALTAYNLWIP